jgi:hypothetical protein
MNTDLILIAGAFSALPCIIVDAVAHTIQRGQMRIAGVLYADPFVSSGHIFLSTAINFSMCAAIAYVYYIALEQSTSAFLIGGMIWLMVATPVIISLKFADEIQRRTFAVRVFAWFFKTVVAALLVTYWVS